MSDHVSTYDSWRDLVDASTLPEQTVMGRASRRPVDSGFSGTDTFEVAIELARNGWADGAARLDNLTARLAGKLGNVAHVKRIGFDIMGPGSLDVGRYSIGHPESMMVWQPTEELSGINPDRVLKLILNGCYPGSEGENRIYWRGAAAFAIVDLAESSGVRVEVEVWYMTAERDGGTDNRLINRVTVKRAQDHMSPDVLAFALCHPAALRRIEFGVNETFSEQLRRAYGCYAGHNYGYVGELSKAEQVDESAIYIGSEFAPFRDANTTAQWVKDKLREHDIEVEVEK